ncbi:DUF6049 family protein [Streptomyces sp. SP18CS02]|uniref:DUF6049 family protein n=1 Tax=Streptomyces sp. SP18CS02 TaxID=3002531 RepID=UPI002E7A6427|nr:DUF6049 family protein [Streptomyces sp. SP18CS02]MEE1754354.1 DUF6049 family protein [Streptomyces sp. SP18CS02]
MAEAAEFQGRSPSPARRWLRRTASVITGVPLLAGLLCGPAAPSASAAESRAGARGVDVSLDTLTPSAPVKGDTLTVSGTVTNEGKETVSQGQVDLRVGPSVSSRGAIEAVSKRGAFTQDGDGTPVGGTYTFKIPRLAAGGSQDFSLAVPVDKLGLDEEGVYQLGVSLSGRTPGDTSDRVLGIERTFLPWQPDAAEKKTQFTYLWPLISSPHMSAQTGSDDQQTPVLDNEALAAELAPGGRLEQLVSLGAELPVTWVIDPDLLATVDAMTRSYQVKDGTATVAGKNQAVAKQWLSALDKAVQGHKIVALPYGDPDLASLAHRGKDVSGSLSHLQPATEVAETTVETILHVKPSVDFAWPVEGALDPSIVDVATSAGADKVIARSDSLHDDLSYSPTAARPIGGGTTAVVSDAFLSKAFAGDMTHAGDSTLAVQRFLAHTLTVTQQQPGKQRSIVVAPQRMPTVSQAQTMAGALRGLAAQRWTQPSDLVAAAAAKPDPRATTRVPSTARYPQQLRRQELPVQAFQEMKTTQDTLDNFKVILTAAYRVVTPFGNAINREMSTSWRGHPEPAQVYRAGVFQYLKSLTAEVQLIDKSDLTLSGRSATIPVTVQNRLLQGVDHLVLRLTSTKPTRLKLNGDSVVAQQPVRIDGGHSQSVKFTASANANGPVPMTAQLYTEDGKPYGKPMSFTVKVSEITPTVMLVIAGGVLLLVLAGIRMYTHRKRAAARDAAAQAETDAGNAADGSTADEAARDGSPEDEAGRPAPDGSPEDEPASDEASSERTTADESDEERAGRGPTAGSQDPGQPSDPTPDTGAQSTDPSGPGEKVDR